MNASIRIVPNIQQDLLHVINEGRTLQQVATIPQNDASLAAFATNVALSRSLHELATNPLAFSPARYPGVLTEQRGQNEVAGVRARYYIRVLTVRVQDLQSYAESYPADAEWAQAIVMSTSSTTVNLLYVGMTTESTPLARHTADVASPPQSRLGNIIVHFKSIGVTHWRVFEWMGLSRPIANADDVRTTSIFGDIERNLIALMRGKGLNSASGGATCNWEPTAAFMARVGGVFISYRSTNPTLALPSRVPAGFWNTMSTSIRSTLDAAHAFFASREQFSRQTRPTVVNQVALEEVKVDAESHMQMCGGRVLSVFITKDITEEALQGGYGYDAPTAGFAPQLERRIRAVIQPMVQAWAGTIQLPRLNLWACTLTHKHTRVALKYLSLYLKNVKPLLVVSHSSNVAHLLQLDMLSSVWPDSQACAAFARGHSPRIPSPADDSQLAELEHPRFLEILGEICIITYGPDDADYALHIAERHTGSMRYYPALAPLYCELHLLCKAVYAISVSEMCKRAPAPAPTVSPLPWLKRTRDNIQRVLTESGLAALVAEKKAEIRARESHLLSQRVLSAAQRGSEAGAAVPRASPTEASYLLQGQVAAGLGYNPLELPPQGEYLTPHSLQVLLAAHAPNRAQLLDGSNVTTAGPRPPAAGNLRLLQWAVTMDTHYERVDRGIKVAYRPPCPSVLEFGSVEHRNWYLTRATGVTYHQSARSFGKSPTDVLTTAEDRAHYNETRRRVGRTMSDRSTNSFASSITKMLALASETCSRRTTEYIQIECQLCGEVELKTSQTVHICSGREGEKGTPIANAQNTMWRRHLLYPHDVFDFYSTSQKQQLIVQIQEDGRFSFKDAADILDDANINLRAQLPQSIQDLLAEPVALTSAQASSSTAPPPPSDQQVLPPLGPIFWLTQEEQTAAGQEWIATMAMDRILRHLNRAPFSRYPQGRDIPDDSWAINLQLDQLKHHIEDQRASTQPLTTVLCSSPVPNACKARVVHFPFTKTHRQSPRNHNNCYLEAAADGAKKRSWKWMAGPVTLETRYTLQSLLELPAEAVRYYWLRARDHKDQQFWFNMLDWDASGPAERARKRPRSG
ncbi:hypothetical protein BGZ68_001242 [Mortierella alpina]|nr:hypothetical protein BGZ68_001242 [Mortierella alpina]